MYLCNTVLRDKENTTCFFLWTIIIFVRSPTRLFPLLHVYQFSLPVRSNQLQAWLFSKSCNTQPYSVMWGLATFRTREQAVRHSRGHEGCQATLPGSALLESVLSHSKSRSAERQGQVWNRLTWLLRHLYSYLYPVQGMEELTPLTVNKNNM